MSVTRVPTASELIAEYGDKMPGRRCGCCGQTRIYAIMYVRPHTIALLCANCDVALDEKR